MYSNTLKDLESTALVAFAILSFLLRIIYLEWTQDSLYGKNIDDKKKEAKRDWLPHLGFRGKKTKWRLKMNKEQNEGSK